MIRNNSTVYLATSATSGELVPVFDSVGYELWPSQRDDLLLWSDWTDWSPTNRAKLRAYTPEAGTFILEPGENDVTTSAITDERVFWLEASGLSSISGTSESVKVFWAARTTDPADFVRQGGLTLPHTYFGPFDLSAFGDRVAMRVSDDTGKGILIADVATSKTWLVPDRPGRHFRQVLAMNATTVLVSEFQADDPGLAIDSLVRLELNSLDQLSKGWR